MSEPNASQWHVGAGNAAYVFSPDTVKPIKCNSQAKAARIVQCVNAHEDLLDALVLALPFVEDAETDVCYKAGAVRKVTKQIRAAIEKAERRTA